MIFSTQVASAARPGRSFRKNVPVKSAGTFRDPPRRRHTRCLSKSRRQLPKIASAKSRSPSPAATAKPPPKILPLRFSAAHFGSRKQKATSTITSVCRARFWKRIAKTKSPFGSSGMNHPGEIAALARHRRARRRHHHQHRHRAHRVHGIARSDRAGKRRAGGIDRSERLRCPECGR